MKNISTKDGAIILLSVAFVATAICLGYAMMTINYIINLM